MSAAAASSSCGWIGTFGILLVVLCLFLRADAEGEPE